MKHLNKIYTTLFVLIISLQFNPTNAFDFSPKDDTTSVSDTFVYDYHIIEMLDSLVNIKYFNDFLFTTDTSILNTYNFPFDTVPTYHDTIYEARIELLNAETPFELVFNNHVKNFINLYAVRKRDLTSRMLGLAELYFPMFEEQLDKYDLPLELKYLAIVESALIPTAGSRVGAKGLWQFMYGTGKVYGLKVTSFVDDRFDPEKSTIAACEHLGDLYDIYEDWSLALAAYNSGAGNVNKAMRRAGGVKSFWAIQPFLPRETRGYVPAFIAVNYVMSYSAEHNLYPVDPGILYNGIDTVIVKDVLSFDQISEMLDVPLEDIKFLNPSFKKGIIPAINGKEYSLRLPKEYIGDFINNETALYNFKSKKGIEKDKLLAEIKKAKQRNYHIVRSGENLGSIANKYGTSVRKLKSWNNLRSNTIYPRQKLIVYGKTTSSKTSKHKSKLKNIDNLSKDFHTVKSGESLAIIANKYNCSVTDLKSWNNLKRNTIHPKQKLIVYPDSKQITKKTEKVSNKYVYHTVRKGDTLWDIAEMYKGVTVKQIKNLNNIRNARKLKPGQKIKVGIKS